MMYFCGDMSLMKGWGHSRIDLLLIGILCVSLLFSSDSSELDSFFPKLSWIFIRPSIQLLVIPLHCLFISAVSCMRKLDWFDCQWWRTGKMRTKEKCLEVSATQWHGQMVQLDGENYLTLDYYKKCFLMSSLIVLFRLLPSKTSFTRLMICNTLKWPNTNQNKHCCVLHFFSPT